MQHAARRARSAGSRCAAPTGCRYLDDPRQSVYVVDGWNLTGDAFSMDEDGYFWFQARTDDMIISSGYNISGFEVEAALLEHPRGRRVRGRRRARRGARPRRQGVRRRAGAAGRRARGAAGPRQGADRAVQVPAPDRVRRRAAAHADRQGPAQRAAGARRMRRLQPPGWPQPRGLRQRRRGRRAARVRRRADRLGRDRRLPARRPRRPGAARRCANVVAVLAEAGAGPEHVVAADLVRHRPRRVPRRSRRRSARPTATSWAATSRRWRSSRSAR